MDNVFGMLEMTGIIDVIDFLKPTSIYEGFTEVATVFMIYGFPVFFTFAFFARYLEESAKSMAGEAKFIPAIADTLRTAIFMSIYASVGLLLIQLIAAVGEKFYEYGSFSLVSEKYANIIETIKQMNSQSGFNKPPPGANFWDFLKDYSLHGVDSLTSLVGFLFFFATVILFVFIYSFLRLAYCILYCFSYLWGFVALPFMISKKLDMSVGWLRTMLCLLVWPIVESCFFAFVSLMFDTFSSGLIETYSGKLGVSVAMGNAYLLFGITNLILCAISVSAVFVAYFLASNQSAIMGIAAPFIAAGAAGAGMLQNAAMTVTRSTARNLTATSGRVAGGGGKMVGSAISSGVGAMGHAAGRVAGAANNALGRVNQGGVSLGGIRDMFSGGGSGGASGAGSGIGGPGNSSGSGPSTPSAGPSNPSPSSTGAPTGAGSQETAGPSPSTNADSGGGSNTGGGSQAQGSFISDIQKIGTASQFMDDGGGSEDD